MFISYDRQAFIGSKEKDLRLTFDTNILWREEELLLHRGVFGNPLLVPNECLMEIKISGAMPLWLAHTLDSLQIYPCSYSKYAHAYRASKQGASVPERKIHCA